MQLEVVENLFIEPIIQFEDGGSLNGKYESSVQHIGSAAQHYALIGSNEENSGVVLHEGEYLDYEFKENLIAYPPHYFSVKLKIISLNHLKEKTSSMLYEN